MSSTCGRSRRPRATSSDSVVRCGQARCAERSEGESRSVPSERRRTRRVSTSSRPALTSPCAPARYSPLAAASTAAMSIFRISSIAAMARWARASSGSESSSMSRAGTTCHERPKRSLTQPHGPCSPPSVSASRVAVDLRLVGAVDLEGDRLVERELGAAVQRDELLAVELEADGHDGARVARPRLAVARDLHDPRAREDRRVEPRGVLALRVEPQARCDLRHGCSSRRLGPGLAHPTGRPPRTHRSRDGCVRAAPPSGADASCRAPTTRSAQRSRSDSPAAPGSRPSASRCPCEARRPPRPRCRIPPAGAGRTASADDVALVELLALELCRSHRVPLRRRCRYARSHREPSARPSLVRGIAAFRPSTVS